MILTNNIPEPTDSLYSNFSIDDLEKALKELVPQTGKRDIQVITGPVGMRMIDQSMKRLVTHDTLVELRKDNRVSKEEADNLYNMIESPDFENFVVANEIINNIYFSNYVSSL